MKIKRAHAKNPNKETKRNIYKMGEALAMGVKIIVCKVLSLKNASIRCAEILGDDLILGDVALAKICLHSDK